MQKFKAYYNKKIEQKWQKFWEKKGAFKASSTSDKPKKYALSMFPYPSGAGLHVGHPRGYIANDVYARLMRIKGFNVLHPMGFDSFGLPAEQYAIKTGNNPKVFTDKLVKQYRKQLDIIGFGYDWSRQIATHRPEYYKWTQWIFLKQYDSWYNKAKDRAEPIETLIKILEKEGNEKLVRPSFVGQKLGGGDADFDNDTKIFSASDWSKMNEVEKQKVLMKYRLAYEGESEVNWCPELGTVLANDEIENGPDGKPVSERGGFPVVKKNLRQWFLRITAYAERLIKDLDTVDWPSHIKEIQKNWIGQSEGSQIPFKLNTEDGKFSKNLEVFTTRVDTLFGVTYIVLAPDNEFSNDFIDSVSNKTEVLKYIREVKNKTSEDRISENKEKTGVPLEGVFAINPANGEKVPVWIADYVLASYGTGAVMAVPAHDDRDFAFANKYNLPIKQVIAPFFIDKDNVPLDGKKWSPRKNVQAVIKHPEEDKIIQLHWKEVPWKTFVIGGVEEGESYEDAIIREIKEETGYKNFKKIEKLGWQMESHFYAKHKDINRQAFTQVFVVELSDLEKEDLSDEESKKHKIVWVPISEINKTYWPCSELPEISAHIEKDHHAFVGEGKIINSGKFDGLSSEEARKEITKAVGGKFVTKFKMRDAVFARQRYWGEPIPLIYEKDGTIKALRDKDLPLELPNVKSYAPTGNAESPLGSVKDWIKKGYETNTMPGWAGSSWYFLRYMDPKNKSAFANEKALKYWGQVDMYVGGAEHATGHLLYSRFWNKFLYDLKLVPNCEPFKALRNQGMILGSDNRKMSKRWGNVINPDDVVNTYGADTLRVFEMFIGPFDSQLPWSTDGIVGSRRFIERVWKLQNKVLDKSKKVKTVENKYEQTLHKTIKKVGEDIESFNFNTAISAMMICLNEMEKSESISKDDFESFLKILYPFAPHITEELWTVLGNKKMIQESGWPKFDHKKMISDTITLMVQVNGRVRGELVVSNDIDENTALNLAKNSDKLSKWLEGGEILKVIFVPGRLINIVVKVSP